jgi:large subunit ribosomal protein L30
MAAKAKLKVVQIRSGLGRVPKQREALKGLGLKGPNSTVVVDNTPSFRGQIKRVLHLVKVEETNG